MYVRNILRLFGVLGECFCAGVILLYSLFCDFCDGMMGVKND